MYRLKILDTFSSAHQLRGYQGNCEELHGHNWKIAVQVKGEQLNEIGLLFDFKELKQAAGKLVNELDHRLLNEHAAFRDSNPSSELIARYIYTELARMLPAGVAMDAVTVWESDNASATYSED